MTNAPYVVAWVRDACCLTPQARVVLDQAACIAGYQLYLDLVPPELLRGKAVISTGMRHEEESLRRRRGRGSESGRAHGPGSTGDPGVYALAGLTLETLAARGLLEHVPLTVVPGVPAVCAAAALLGAPLTHDFACISLSDLLTSWETIQRRLTAALEAGFRLRHLQPGFQGRQPHQLDQALAEARRLRRPDCPVGLVRKAFRPGQEVFGACPGGL